MDQPTVYERQKDDYFVKLLAAQAQRYLDYKRTRLIWLLITIIAGIWATGAIALPESIRAVVVVVSILVIIAGLTLVARIEGFRHQAALIQEQYDCELLDIPWPVTEQRRPDQDLVAEAAGRYLTKYGEPERKRFQTWYRKDNADHPIRKARVLCQKENIYYDSDLRRWWAAAIAVSCAVLLAVVLVVGIVLDLSLRDFVLGPFLLLVPILSIGAYAWDGHRRTAAKHDVLKFYLNTLVAQVDDPRVTDDEIRFNSRVLQDTILQRRAESPSVPDWYNKLYLRYVVDRKKQNALNTPSVDN